MFNLCLCKLVDGLHGVDRWLDFMIDADVYVTLHYAHGCKNRLVRLCAYPHLEPMSCTP